MAKPQKTKQELQELVWDRTTGMQIQHLEVRSDPSHGWSTFVMAKPSVVAEYQRGVDKISAGLRAEFDLKK